MVARRHLGSAPVPITLTDAAVEALPFPDAQFDSVVATLVFCSVGEPMLGLREIWRVLKPGGMLLLVEHVRAQGKVAAWVQDALVMRCVRFFLCWDLVSTSSTMKTMWVYITFTRLRIYFKTCKEKSKSYLSGEYSISSDGVTPRVFASLSSVVVVTSWYGSRHMV